MSNALTCEWDLLQAIRVSAVNEAIAADLRSTRPSFPTGFDHTYVYARAPGTPSVRIAGTFTRWAVTGGSGQNVQLTIGLTLDRTSSVVDGSTRSLIDWVPGAYDFAAVVELTGLHYQPGTDGRQSLSTTTQTQVASARIDGTRTAAPATTTPLDQISFFGGGRIDDAFADWCATHLAPAIVYCFLALDASMLNGRTFAWATPTLASYSVNQAPNATDGVFAQFSMTGGRQPGTPSPVVQGDLIPAGSDAVLGVATDRFLIQVLQSSLARSFAGATPADFTPTYTDTDAAMATGLESTIALAFPTFTLDNSDTVAATIPARNVQLTVSGDALQIRMNGISFECPEILGLIPSGITVTLNYACTATLAMAGNTVTLTNESHSLNYSVSYSSAYTWVSIGVGVLSVILVLSGVFSEVGVAAEAAEAEAGAAAVSEAADVAEAAGSVDVSGAAADVSALGADISTGSEMTAADASQMSTVASELDAAAAGTPVNASGYIVRTLGRTVLAALTGYGAYANVKFQMLGNAVRLLDGGDPVDPVTLHDFSGALLSPVSWTNVADGWTPNAAWLADGLAVGMTFRPGAAAPAAPAGGHAT